MRKSKVERQVNTVAHMARWQITLAVPQGDEPSSGKAAHHMSSLICTLVDLVPEVITCVQEAICCNHLTRGFEVTISMRISGLSRATKRASLYTSHLRTPPSFIGQSASTSALLSSSQTRMSSQYKDSVTWGHNVTETSDKANRVHGCILDVCSTT